MSIYWAYLTQSFPHAFVGPRRFILDCVDELIADHHPNGSSFAVTADVSPDQLKLWLSEVSFQRLKDAYLISGAT